MLQTLLLIKEEKSIAGYCGLTVNCRSTRVITFTVSLGLATWANGGLKYLYDHNFLLIS